MKPLTGALITMPFYCETTGENLDLMLKLVLTLTGRKTYTSDVTVMWKRFVFVMLVTPCRMFCDVPLTGSSRDVCCGFSSHKTLILSPWWLGTVSSGTCFRSTAALLSIAGRPDEGCLWWSCNAHCSPLLLPRSHEAGRYNALACVFSFSVSQTHTHVCYLHLTNYSQIIFFYRGQ